VTSEPIDESCCDATGHQGGAEDQAFVLRRELSQMSLHRVDEHRRQSDDAHAGR
jgi:hypothetical protein